MILTTKNENSDETYIPIFETLKYHVKENSFKNVKLNLKWQYDFDD